MVPVASSALGLPLLPAWRISTDWRSCLRASTRLEEEAPEVRLAPLDGKLHTIILAVEKGTPAFNLFMSLLSDALLWLLPGKGARVRNHCEALGMSSEQIDKLKRKYWRRKCR